MGLSWLGCSPSSLWSLSRNVSPHSVIVSSSFIEHFKQKFWPHHQVLLSGSAIIWRDRQQIVGTTSLPA